MGGNTADIYRFNLVLSVGDISENQPGIKRKQTLEHLYSVFPNDEGHQAAIEIAQKAKAMSINSEKKLILAQLELENLYIQLEKSESI
ncbi:MAG: hypothetical protein P4L49_07980 [Desulfosporosinus sp.]|nr:hypothetical protein [Desulfosporosinus sp.]